MLDTIYLHRTCRACTANLVEVLNLGSLRLNAFPQHVHEIPLVPQVPLILMVCTGCGLAQLDRTVPPDWMYRTYHYRSGVNEMMVAELQGIVREARELVPVGAGDAVLDIGANDGTLLAAYYAPHGILHHPTRVAYEPALNLADRLTQHCEIHFSDYFPQPGHAPKAGYKIITAIACAYDLEDPRAFFQALHDQLAPGGVAVVQFQDLLQQMESAAFDNIVHEHLEYYSCWSLSHLVGRVGLTIQRAQTTPINGGSLRLHLRRREDQIQAERSVGLQLLHEAQAGLDTPTLREGNLAAFTQFARRISRVRKQISAVVQHALDQGCVIDAYGASTKGNLLLQVLNLGPGQIRQAIDRSPEKVGLHTITGIPIVSEATAQIEPADLWIAPIWQFKDSVLAREAWYLEQGGTLVFPLPAVEVVRRSARP